MKKRIFSTCLILVLILSSIAPAAALSEMAINSGQVKVAYINNIANDGTNIKTDEINPQAILENQDFEIAFSATGRTLEFEGNVFDIEFSVSGELSTTNENGNLLLYEGTDAIENCDIAYMSIERELEETALFFRDFYENNNSYTNVIKLYMQPQNTNALIMIEVFVEYDFVSNLKSVLQINYNSVKANELQCWFVKYYNPIQKASNNLAKASSDTSRALGYDTLDMSETYDYNGDEIVIRFVARLYYTTSNMVRGGHGEANPYFSIIESKIESDYAANQSSTQDYLRLTDLNIKFKTFPYVVCISQEPYRSKIDKSTGFNFLNFDVSFGFSLAAISASATFDFNQEAEMRSSLVALPYTGTNGVKSTECGELPSNYHLNRKDGYYGMKVDYQDALNQSRTGTAVIQFDYYVDNLYRYTDSYSGTLTKSVDITII